MSVMACQDIHVVVVFLATHFNKLDKNDLVKLNRVLKYLKVISEMNLDFRIGGMSVVKW